MILDRALGATKYIQLWFGDKALYVRNRAAKVSQVDIMILIQGLITISSYRG